MDYSPESKDDESLKDDLLKLGSRYKNLSRERLAEEAVQVATRQIMACADFKKPRLQRLGKYWALYDGQVPKKLRQLFNVPIPVFPGMIDTLNAQYDTPVQLTFREGDPSDYFKVQKINGAFQMEVMNTTQNSKWDSKLSMIRKHAIMNGIGIPKLTATSDPEYKSELEVVNLKNYTFQPRGGLYVENHLFNGEEDIQKTQAELVQGALNGSYEKKQVKLLIERYNNADYLPMDNKDFGEKLSRFKPLGLDPENHSYVGQTVYKLAQQILEIDGTRYLLVFQPWTQTYLRFEKWSDICSGDLYPWRPYTTHEDDENLLSKSYGDDLYAAADAIVGMVNQELTNREKQNFHPRAYDKDMFTDVRKLDEAMHRPDALVPADTKNGTRRISEGIYEFKVGELRGTIDLVDWITGTLGRNTGATDMAQGSVEDVSKKASVAFAEQKSVSKRLSWGSQPWQTMMADLGKLYLYGLKDHMPSKMAIRMMGENGWDWDEVSRVDLNTTKDVDVLIVSSDKQMEESEMKVQKRKEALLGIGADPLMAAQVNAKWRAEETLRSVGGFEDADVAVALDVKSSADKKSLAKASDSIQQILRGKKPDLWYGANIAFVQKIVDYASDKRSTLKDKFEVLMQYAMEHTDIVRQNLERKAAEEAQLMGTSPVAPGSKEVPPEQSGLPGGVSRAMNIAEQAGA